MKSLAILLIAILTACTSPEEAHRALKSAGYSNIKTGDYAWFACGEDDFYHTKFTAKNPAGMKTSGVVCSGLLFKISTIRH